MERGDVDDIAEPRLFQAVLTPHRSLSRGGFLALMLVFGGVSFAAGVAFWIIGAWPVFGFFGLDVALIYWAFQVNFARARAFEEVLVTPSELRLRRVNPRGHAMEWVLNPRWVRLERTEHPEFGVERLALVSHGRALPIAAFLNPEEKASFAQALGAALAAARRGFDYHPVPAAASVGNRVEGA